MQWCYGSVDCYYGCSIVLTSGLFASRIRINIDWLFAPCTLGCKGFRKILSIRFNNSDSESSWDNLASFFLGLKSTATDINLILFVESPSQCAAHDVTNSMYTGYSAGSIRQMAKRADTWFIDPSYSNRSTKHSFKVIITTQTWDLDTCFQE